MDEPSFDAVSDADARARSGSTAPLASVFGDSFPMLSNLRPDLSERSANGIQWTLSKMPRSRHGANWQRWFVVQVF